MSTNKQQLSPCQPGVGCCAAAIVVWLFLAANALAGEVNLAWDHPGGAEGFRVFMRADGAAYDYASPAWQGTEKFCTINKLGAGVTYYFVARAFAGKDESGDSNEVSYAIPSKITTIYFTEENEMPFVVTSYVSGEEITHYEVELDGVLSTVEPQRNPADGTYRLRMDVSGVEIGQHTLRMRGVNVWGPGEFSDPFVFTKALPSKPSGITLSEE